MEDLIRVEFLKHMPPFFVGDRAGYPLAEVERMEALGAVVRCEPTVESGAAAGAAEVVVQGDTPSQAAQPEPSGDAEPKVAAVPPVVGVKFSDLPKTPTK